MRARRLSSALLTRRSYGPREAPASAGYSDTGRLRCDFRYAPFARRGLHSPPGPRGAAERDLSAALEAALRPAVLLDAFPKAQVDVFVLCLDGGGCGGGGPAAASFAGELAAATLSASLALAHAGVALRDLVAAVSLARVAGGGGGGEDALLLDPSPAELAAAAGWAFLAALPSCDAVASLALGGEWPAEAVEEAVELALDGARSLDPPLRALLRDAVAAERGGG